MQIRPGLQFLALTLMAMAQLAIAHHTAVHLHAHTYDGSHAAFVKASAVLERHDEQGHGEKVATACDICLIKQSLWLAPAPESTGLTCRSVSRLGISLATTSFTPHNSDKAFYTARAPPFVLS